MPNAEEIVRLRTQSGDKSVMRYLYEQDPAFKVAVDRVRQKNPEMTPFEQEKFSSAMLDIHYGKKNAKQPKQDPLTSQLAQNAFNRSEEKSYIRQTIENIPGSAANLAGGLYQAVRHPFKTAGALADIAVGGGANLLEVLTGNEQLFDLKSEEVASAVGQFYKERYGGIDNFAETIKNDPVGALADLAAVFSVGGAGLQAAGKLGGLGARIASGAPAGSVPFTGGAGQVARIAGAMEGLGGQLNVASRIADPLRIAAKVAAPPLRLLKKAVNMANNQNIRSAFNLTPSQMQRIARLGDDPASFMAREGIVGNTADDVVRQLERLQSSSYDDVNRSLASVPGTFVTEKIPGMKQMLAQLDDMFRYPGLEDELAAVKRLGIKGSLTLTELNEVKRLVDTADFIFKKSNEVKGSLLAQGASKIRHNLKSFIEKAAEDAGVPGIKEMNMRTMLSKEILDEILLAEAKGQRFLSLRDALYATAGGAIGGSGAAFVTLILERLAATPAVATRLSLALHSLSSPQFNALMNAVKTGVVTNEARIALQSVVNAIEETSAEPVQSSSQFPVENPAPTPPFPSSIPQ